MSQGPESLLSTQYIAIQYLTADDSRATELISWQQFYRDMLTVGEVRPHPLVVTLHSAHHALPGRSRASQSTLKATSSGCIYMTARSSTGSQCSRHLYDVSNMLSPLILIMMMMILQHNRSAIHRFRFSIASVPAFERQMEQAQVGCVWILQPYDSSWQAELGIHPDDFVPIDYVQNPPLTFVLTRTHGLSAHSLPARSILSSLAPIVVVAGVWFIVMRRFKPVCGANRRDESTRDAPVGSDAW